MPSSDAGTCPPERPPSGFARKLLRRTATTAGFALLAAVVVALCVLLGVNTPAGKRMVLGYSNAALSSVWQGKIRIEGFDRVDLGGIRGGEITVVDANGVVVSRASGVRVRVSALGLARAFVSRKAPRIVIDHVSVGSAEVVLDPNPDGTLRLAGAFEPKDASISSATLTDEPTVILPEIDAHTVWAHGELGGIALDCNVRELRSTLIISPSEKHIVVSQFLLETRALPRGADARGQGAVDLHLASEDGPLRVQADFHGTVGEAPVGARMTWRGQDVDADIEIPMVDAASLHRMVPEVEIAHGVSARITFQGALPQLEGRITATSGSALLTARGTVDLDTVRGSIDASLAGVDARAFSDRAIETSLGLTGTLSFARSNGRLEGEIALTAAGVVGKVDVPPTSLDATYTVGLGGTNPSLTLAGKLHGADSTNGLSGTFFYAGGGGTTHVNANLQGHLGSLATTPLGSWASGTLDVRARGDLALPGRVFSVDATGDYADGRVGPLRVHHASLYGHMGGMLDAPEGSATVDASDVLIGGASFPRAGATADGTMHNLRASAYADGQGHGYQVRAKTRMDIGEEIEFLDSALHVTHKGLAAFARTGRIQLSSRRTVVEGGIVEGMGSPLRFAATVGSDAAALDVSSDGFDVGKFGRMLPDENVVRSGTLRTELHLRASPEALEGAVVLDVERVVSSMSRAGNLHLEGRSSGGEVIVSGRVAEGEHLLADLRQARVALDPARTLSFDGLLRRARAIDMDVTLDLGAAARLLPKALDGVHDVNGTVDVRASAVRTNRHALVPLFYGRLQTKDLSFVLGGENGNGAAERSWRGFDLSLGVQVDPVHSALFADGEIVGPSGILLTADAKAAQLPEPLVSASGADLASLLRIPLAVRATLPRQTLRSLPLVSADLEADVMAWLDLTGSLEAPVVDLEGHISGMRSASSALPPGMTVDCVAHFSDDVTAAQAQATTRAGRILTAAGRLGGTRAFLWGGDARHANDASRANGARSPPDLSVEAALTAFPLGALPGFADVPIRGKASGALSYRYRDRVARADVTMTGFQVGQEAFDRAEFHASAAGDTLSGDLSVSRQAALLSARGSVGLEWTNPLGPGVDTTKAALFSMLARSFPINVVGPLVEQTVSDLRGTVDGTLQYAGVPGGRPAATGSLALRDGSLVVTTLGQEFHGIEADVTLSPDGLLRVQRGRARGTSGLLLVQASAQLDGLGLSTAKASAQIPKGEPIPISLQGVQVGTIYGGVEASAAVGGDLGGTNVLIDIPSLHVRLPPSDPRSVQALNEPEKVQVGTYRTAGRFVTLPLDQEDTKAPRTSTSRPSHVTVRLGRDATIERGRTLRVTMSGSPELDVGDTTSMTGQIVLSRGALEVQGKTFEIEKGTVTFVGDPSNPEVVVRAGWTAADGTRVVADFVGPLKTGKVTLRSEPGRPQDEILALILFGTASGSAATPYAQQTSDGTTRAGSAAGGLVAEGLNRGIDALTGLDITTNVDTSDASNPRPEVQVRIARDISLQLAFVLGTPPPGANPDRAFATIDWRFLRNWSLATTFGDQGTSIGDVVWRHRY